MSAVQPDRPLAIGLAQRWRRPGRARQTRQQPGLLAARSIQFAGTASVRPLPHAGRTATGPAPGGTLTAATRSEVPVHRLAPVLAAGAMVVARDLVPLQPPGPAPDQQP